MYPDLIKDVRIRVIELMDHVLSTYDRAISEYTAKEFSRCAFYGQLVALGTDLMYSICSVSPRGDWSMGHSGLAANCDCIARVLF